MAPRPGSRILAALLFTDIVGSTRHAEDMGDRRWRELLARHHRLLRAAIRANGGRELDTAGDGFFAMFDTPAAAIRCACAAIDAVRTLGVEIRAGVHIGECEVLDGKVSGVNVHIAARTMAAAQAGEVYVTSSVRDLVRGGGFGFADRGFHQLKGIEGGWALFEVTGVDDVPRPPPQGEEDALRRRDAIQPPSIVQRRGLRLAVGGAVGAAALVALALVLLEARGGPSSPHAIRSTEPLTEYVARVDPTTRHLAAKIAVGKDPEAVAFGEGSAWVVNAGDGTVSRVDPARGKVIATITVGAEPDAIAVGPVGVWVANVLSKSIVEIDPLRNRVEKTVSVDYSPTGIAETSGAVWTVAANFDQVILTGIDPISGDRIGARDLPSSIGAKAVLAASPTDVFVGDVAGDVVEIDPSSLATAWSRPLEKPIGGMAVQADSVWVATVGTPGTVFQLDVGTGRLLGSVAAGGGGFTGGGFVNGPDRIGSDGDHLWVTDWRGGTVTEVVPAGGEAEPAISVGEAATDVAAGDGVVWVTVASPSA